LFALKYIKKTTNLTFKSVQLEIFKISIISYNSYGVELVLIWGAR
jgi:hypothetical protein